MEKTNLVLISTLYLIAYAIDPLTMLLAFKKFLKPKYRNKVYYILSFIGLYALVLIKQGLILFTNSKLTVLFLPLLFLYVLIIVIFLFGGSIKKKIAVFITVYLLSVITDGIFSIILICYHISSNTMMTFGITSSIITLVIRISNLLLYFLIQNFYEIIEEKNIKKPYTIVVYCIMFLSSFLGLIFFSDNLNNRISVLYCTYSMQVMLFLIITFYVVSLFHDRELKEKEAVKQARMAESKLALFKYTKETYEEIKSIRHDLKKHYNYLLELNRLRDYKGIEDYLLDLCSKLNPTDDLYLCDNLILAVALSNIQQKAKQEDIAFSKTITVNTFPFSDSELNSVISNVLDNAYEAVSKVTKGEKMITLSIKKINAQEILIYCANTYNKDAYFEIPLLSTIKRDKNNHGYGTKIVKSIVKRYEGTAVYWKDETNFYVKIIVRGKEQNEDTNM